MANVAILSNVLVSQACCTEVFAAYKAKNPMILFSSMGPLSRLCKEHAPPPSLRQAWLGSFGGN
jgi:hypothetical protein